MTDKIYNIKEPVEINSFYGPYWTENKKYQPLQKVKTVTSFLGFKLNTPFGISACPLTFNARYISHYSKLGFDLITFKTVRSIEWRGLPYPNWMYVNAPKQLTIKDLDNPIVASSNPYPNQEISTANSFGIHSIKPELWIKEYELAKTKLSKGQILILSMVITNINGQTQIENAIELANLAKKTTAKIIEFNFSCPNMHGEGLIYEDIKLTTEICKHMKKILGKRHLIVKVGYYRSQKKLKQFLENTKGIISGISSTNTYNMQIIDNKGKAAFGKDRKVAGVAGASIRNLSIKQAKNIVRLKKSLKLKDFVVIGIGGVTKPQDIHNYLKTGVDAVQSATGVWDNPNLAIEFRNTYNKN